MGMDMPSVASVSLLENPYAIDRVYEYFIPQSLRSAVAPGRFVMVPFGGANRKGLALVQSVSDTSRFAFEKLKPVMQAVDEEVSLSAEGVALCLFMKEQTFCTIGEAVRALLPAAALSKIKEYYTAATDATSRADFLRLTPQRQAVVTAVANQGRADILSLREALGTQTNAALRELTEQGFLLYTCEAPAPTNKQYADEIYLSQTPEETAAAMRTLRGKTQLAVLETLLAGPSPFLLSELVAAVPGARAALRALADKGLLYSKRTDRYRNPYAALADTLPLPPLTPLQQTAANTLIALTRSGVPKAALLHGVTGSGKTRVMQEVISAVIRDGRQAIVLVPEISLTGQTVHAFASVYGERIAVLHSSLSAGERFDAWRRIKNGEVDVCIGTRSAIFAPFANLGLIILDEEQEHTYKSDGDPKYHARDIARFRAAHHNATMLLASATPSLESYYKAVTGVYTLVKLNERVHGGALPAVQVVDLRQEQQSGRISPLSNPLRAALTKVKADAGQAILFVNRRGYHNFMTCPECGTAVTCPHCSVSLTYHRREGERGHLACHYCGYRSPVPDTCKHCGGTHLHFIGFGTQQVEERLATDMPDLRVMRMDADSTTTKDAYERLLSRFRREEADVLLGTQMVTKGHDFPNVVLVGVLFAEQSLFLDDYRANERTFDLITQVVGRAGRATRPGVALVQTYNPDHPVLKLAMAQDYETFYKEEIALREALVFPPFCDIVVLTISASDETQLLHVVHDFGESLKAKLRGDFSDVKVVLFGPFEASVYKINETYRMRFLVKCKNNARLRALVREMLREFHEKTYKRLSIAVDINPTGI